MNPNVRHKIDEKPLLTESYMINHKGDRFSIDFKGASLQHLEPSTETTVIISHKAVLLDPWRAKEFSKNLLDNIAKYEATYGEIAIPAAVEKDMNVKEPSKKITGLANEKNGHSYLG